MTSSCILYNMSILTLYSHSSVLQQHINNSHSYQSSWDYCLSWLWDVWLIKITVLMKALSYHLECFSWRIWYASYWIKVLCRQTSNRTCRLVNRTQLTTRWKVPSVHNLITEGNKCSRTLVSSCASWTNHFHMLQTVQSSSSTHSITQLICTLLSHHQWTMKWNIGRQVNLGPPDFHVLPSCFVIADLSPFSPTLPITF